MRNILGMAVVIAAMTALSGCSSGRWQLSKSEPPKNVPEPEERVRYGFPWSKPKDEAPAVAAEMPAELKEQLARSKATPPKSTLPKDTLSRAAEAEARGDLDAARAAYLEVLSDDPKSTEAHHRLGVIADMRQDPQSADQHYQQAYSLNRRDADLLCDMGYSLYLRGRFDDSERRLKEALEVNSYHRAALSNLGLVYGKQGRYEDSLAMFRKAGTESEAQRNIAQLFPNGRPGPGPEAVAATSGQSQPFPSSNAASSSAPPMPSDVDQRLASLVTDPVQPGGPMLSRGQPANAPNAGQPGWPSRSPNPPAAVPASFAAAPQSAVAAKPQGTGQPWTGSLDRPLTANEFTAMSTPAQPQQPMMSPFPAVSGTDPAASANPMYAAPVWPPVDGVVPATFQADQSPYGVLPANSPAGSAGNAQLLAAQIAMGAGPGSMIPLASPMAPAMSSFGSSGTMPPASGTRPFSFGNSAPSSPAPTNNTGLNFSTSWANDRSLATPVESSSPNSPAPTRWGQPESPAPASPWASSHTPAGDSQNWRLPPDNSPNMTPVTNSQPFASSSAPASNAGQPPQWPGNAASWPAASSSQPAPTTNSAASWPVIQPAAPMSAPPMMAPAANSATTVPNWPYASGR